MHEATHMTHSLGRCGVVLVAATIVACTGSDAPKIPLAQATSASSVHEAEAAHALIGPAAKVALDSGNFFFRRKAYREALAQYTAASALAPQHAAPIFGIYMVARATKNTALADSALAQIRLRNGPLVPSSPHSLSDSAVQRMHEMIRKSATSG
jgi:hypothetical protein